MLFFMEKRTPHRKLSVVKTLIEAGKVRMTQSAVIGGRRLGFDVDGIVATVLALTPADFYKSMTTHADHRIWQDVYRPTTSAEDLYVKLTVIDEVLIVSFKDL
ncbi:type II toxin-antitoxin system MqsR family toxin [uncultured Thiocystis sp.]|jgi:motility quorum-sensing regulator/GCU-specific mRNA interferase toxin|uniref:type II toxin-antitoxin system MqsR family toxin n=1 Tax=uncultured Thiocystis sp. TaxID=1202134 RepID=UPI0025D8EBD6|nr:type II toxin-antitoxin system MqsR family toxin [uncultured Thiocystis sp.]